MWASSKVPAPLPTSMMRKGNPRPPPSGEMRYSNASGIGKESSWPVKDFSAKLMVRSRLGRAISSSSRNRRYESFGCDQCPSSLRSNILSSQYYVYLAGSFKDEGEASL
jgi:hypothetical protein